MEYLAMKDQADGTRTHRGSWDEDSDARLELYNRAKTMLLEFEKRRARLSRTVSTLWLFGLKVFGLIITFLILGGRYSSCEVG